MIYLKFIPVILYLVEAFAKAQSFLPPLDGSDYSYIDYYSDYYENGGFGESNFDRPSGSGGRWPQQNRFNGSPQEQRGFGSRPQRPGLQQGQGGFGGRPQQGQGGFGGRPQQGQGRFRGRPQQGQGGFGGRQRLENGF